MVGIDIKMASKFYIRNMPYNMLYLCTEMYTLAECHENV